MSFAALAAKLSLQKLYSFFGWLIGCGCSTGDQTSENVSNVLTIKYLRRWNTIFIPFFFVKMCMSVTSIQAAADAFGWGAFKAGRRPVYEGARHAGLGLSSPAVAELGAQSQEPGLGRSFWRVQPGDDGGGREQSMRKWGNMNGETYQKRLTL